MRDRGLVPIEAVQHRGHDGLWDAAAATAHDPLARLAVVPMVLEARGLDVTPATIERFAGVGDTATTRILTRILNDEIRHDPRAVDRQDRRRSGRCREREEVNVHDPRRRASRRGSALRAISGRSDIRG